MRARRSLLVVALAVTVMAGLATPAAASRIGQEGCSPGFWKNHTDLWSENSQSRSYDTDDPFGDVFGVEYGDVTLLESLQGGGGKGIKGARKILARAATAALLNAATEDLGYPLRRRAIFEKVQNAWDGPRRKIIRLAKRLDRLNNLGTEDFC